jgi:hypothetical protein
MTWEYQRGIKVDDDHAIDLTLGLGVGTVGL